MTGENRIDFSSLDPTRNGGRFDTLIQSVVSRTTTIRNSPLTVGYQLRLWAGPAIAVAAAAATVLFIVALLFSSMAGETTERGRERAVVLTQLASGDDACSTYHIVETLGAHYGED